MKQEDKQKKSQKKQIILLVVSSAFLLVFIVYMLLSSDEEFLSTSSGVSSAPIEVENTRSLPGAENNLTTGIEENNSNVFGLSSINDGIDRFFMSLAGKQNVSITPVSTTGTANTGSLPPLVPATGGVIVKLPDLKHPNDLTRVSSVSAPNMPTISVGVPTQISQGPSLQYISISGIACNHGECRASTSAGNFIKGNTIGGGQFLVEKIESISMAGIKTDKRFISY